MDCVKVRIRFNSEAIVSPHAFGAYLDPKANTYTAPRYEVLSKVLGVRYGKFIYREEAEQFAADRGFEVIN